MMYIIPLGTTRKAGKIPYAVLTLVVLNIVIFLGTWYGTNIRQTYQEWGVVPQSLSLITLISSAFLHGGWFHLIGNMLFLLVFGPPVEDRVGSAWFAGLYTIFALSSGLVFTAVQLSFLSEEFHSIPCVGASGAIAGVMGYFLYACWGQQVIVGYWILFVARGTAHLSCPEAFIIFCMTDLIMGYALVSDGMISGTAHWGHIGGLIAGLILGLFLYDEKLEEAHQLSELDLDAWYAMERVNSQDEVWSIRTFLAEKGVPCRAVLLPGPPSCFQILISPKHLQLVKALINPSEDNDEINQPQALAPIKLVETRSRTCSICGESLAGSAVARCYSCQAPTHKECAEFAGGCQIKECPGNRKGNDVPGVVTSKDPEASAAEFDLEKTTVGAARILGHLGVSMSKTCLVFLILGAALFFFLCYVFLVTGGGRAL